MAEKKRIKIWIDLDNTPHVPFFFPVIRELERRGFQVVLTARDAFQVCELADEKGIRYTKIGRHYGKNRFMKVFGLFWRAIQLFPFFMRERPDLAVSHGSRSQTLLCKPFGTATLLITDYEHGRVVPLLYPKWLIVPDSLRGQHHFPMKSPRIRYYRGLKEDVYAPDFKPVLSLSEELGLTQDETIVTVRPPADEAHYHNPESDELLVGLMTRICESPGVRAVLLPRTKQQEAKFRADHPEWFKDGKTVVPSRAVDGLDLIWNSDLVVSGGGTMNREAAALGVPVYSIFRGETAAVDRRLEQEGRLILIKSIEEITTNIPIVLRDKSRLPDNNARPALGDIIDHIEGILRAERILR